MVQETGQHDISDRQLMNANSQIKASEWTEIGQAEVVHTIFGKAKVRIIRKHDKMRRALYWLALGVMLAITWEGWILYQHFETERAEVMHPRFNTNIEASPAVSKSEVTTSPPTTLPVKNSSKPLSQTEINDPVGIDKNKSGLPHDLSNNSQKTILHHPIKPVAPQSAPVATNGNQADKTLQAKPLPKPLMIQPQHAVPIPASSPSAVSSLISPNKEGMPRQNTGDTQFVEPTNIKQ
jgi:hypothetical protein